MHFIERLRQTEEMIINLDHVEGIQLKLNPDRCSNIIFSLSSSGEEYWTFEDPREAKQTYQRILCNINRTLV